VRGASAFRNQNAYNKYVCSLQDRVLSAALSENIDPNRTCMIVMRQLTKVPRSDKARATYVAEDQEMRARLDRLRDRLAAGLRPDRIMKHEVPYASTMTSKTHQTYLTTMVEQVLMG
jgi:hypothetical protein